MPLKEGVNRTVLEQVEERVREEYEVEEELGRGAFSVVLGVRRKSDGKELAMKVINKHDVAREEKAKQRLEVEVKILKEVEHPSIIPLYELVETEAKLYLFMERVDGGELFEKIVEKGSYTEGEAAQVVKSIVSAINYLHERRISHRDLKPENLLLKKGDDTKVMLSDFGLSRILGEESMMSTSCGTPYYVAPEVVTASGYGKEVDMWSIGVITYFLLAGFPPFMGESLPEIVEQIMNADYSFPSPYWDVVSDEGKDFVSKLLVVDPKERLSSEDALEHPWLKRNAETLNTPLQNQSLATDSNRVKEKMKEGKL